MRTKSILAVVLVVAVSCTIASVLIANRRTAENYAPKKNVARTPATNHLEVVPANVKPTPESAPTTVAVETPAAVSPAPVKLQPPNPGNAAPPKLATQAFTARAALGLVGTDPWAEQYWMAAIFDPSLPDQERADLMEDLNEEGLSNPDHPSAADLILLANRLAPIEQALAYADDSMRPHLLEAYKDIINALAGN